MNTFVCLLLACALPNLGRAQPAAPPPESGAAPIVQVAHPNRSFRQPPPPPAGGFWVVETPADRRSATLVHFYTDEAWAIQTDTVQERLNIHKRAVVWRLNSRLSAVLAGQAVPTLATRQKKP